MKDEFLIGIEEMPCLCLIGILPEERKIEQPLFVSIFLQGDFSKVATEGNLAAGVDYSLLQSDLSRLLQKIGFRLIETAAYCLCQWVLGRYAQVEAVLIKLKKPHALAGQGVPLASLKVHRKLGTSRKKNGLDPHKSIQWAEGALFFHKPSQVSFDSGIETLLMADGSELYLQRHPEPNV